MRDEQFGIRVYSECLGTPPTVMLMNPGVVSLLLINGHPRLLRVLTLALTSIVLLPFFLVFLSSAPSSLVLLFFVSSASSSARPRRT